MQGRAVPVGKAMGEAIRLKRASGSRINRAHPKTKCDEKEELVA